jgi:hypothetical protein
LTRPSAASAQRAGVACRRHASSGAGTPEHPEHWQTDDFVPTEELARRQGVKPNPSIDELAQPDLWESDEEYEAFLADLYASQRAGLA